MSAPRLRSYWLETVATVELVTLRVLQQARRSLVGETII